LPDKTEDTPELKKAAPVQGVQPFFMPENPVSGRVATLLTILYILVYMVELLQHVVLPQ